MANFDINDAIDTFAKAGTEVFGAWTQYDLQRRHASNLVNNPFSSGGMSPGSGGGYVNIGSGGVSSAFSGSGSVMLLLLALMLLKR